MLLVSFLLWRCGIFCDLCTVTAFATVCLAAVGDGRCCHGAGFGREKTTAFSGVPPIGFFYMTLHFCSYHFPFSFKAYWQHLLLLSIITLGAGRRGDTERSNCLCFPRWYSKLCINILTLLYSFIFYFPWSKTNSSLSSLCGLNHYLFPWWGKTEPATVRRKHQFSVSDSIYIAYTYKYIFFYIPLYWYLFMWLSCGWNSAIHMQNPDKSLKDASVFLIPSR